MQGVILLTGATGFLGSNLLARLVANNIQVVALKRSFSDLRRIAHLQNIVKFYDIDRLPLSRVFSENTVSTIVHCATDYGRRAVPAAQIVEANLILPLHLLQLACDHNAKAFINADTILDKGINHYSLSKSQFTDWLKLFSHKITCINVALEHFYGPLDDRSKFVTQVINDLLKGIQHLDLTPGKQKRDFIFIDDVVAAFLKIVDFANSASTEFYRFEVGTSQTIEIRRFVQIVKELTGNTTSQLNFGALPYRRNEVMESRVDTHALLQLGWTPQVELREGLRRTIELERNNSGE